MGLFVNTLAAALAITASAAAATTPPVAAAPPAGCLDHSRLFTRAAYHPQDMALVASCGHLLSTETIVKPRSPNRT